jgi:hypothetical protein
VLTTTATSFVRLPPGAPRRVVAVERGGLTPS